jgi:sterol desaturase/sphingolipid hydroxylase (fatty acid hydroxylase superfamily)
MWAIYHVEHPFFERYKVNSRPWPWNESKEEWRILVKKSILLCALNSIVCIPLLLAATMVADNFEVQYGMSVETIPNWNILMANITFCMICEDIGFHFAHRVLHWKLIYPYIHKIHHTYVTTVSIAAEYSHPIDYIFGAVLPGAIGGIFLGKHMHYCTLLLWTVMRVGETIDGHCGYEFSWSPYRLIPFSASAQYHDFHHSHNVGNFSSFFTFWDTFFGTNKSFYEYQDSAKQIMEKIEAEKLGFNKNLQEKLHNETLLVKKDQNRGLKEE